MASGQGSLDRDVYNSNYNLLFRWFVGLSADDPVWDATVFCKNRNRLLNGDIARKFFFFPEAVRATVADWSKVTGQDEPETIQNAAGLFMVGCREAELRTQAHRIGFYGVHAQAR